MEKNVFTYLKETIKKENACHLSLFDPDPTKVELSKLPQVTSLLDEAGTDGFMVGGSTALDTSFVTKVVKKVKEATEKPVILFPSGPGGVSRVADAIFFMVPLNSTNHYFLTKVQALAAPLIKRKELETISMAYLIFHPGGSAAYISDVDPLPRGKPEIAVAYAMAADLIGFDLIYLEAGSGASKPVPAKTVTAVEKAVDTPLITGGGIKSPKQAATEVKAGGDIIVQGTKIEKQVQDTQRVEEEVRMTVNTIKKTGKNNRM